MEHLTFRILSERGIKFFDGAAGFGRPAPFHCRTMGPPEYLATCDVARAPLFRRFDEFFGGRSPATPDMRNPLRVPQVEQEPFRGALKRRIFAVNLFAQQVDLFQ